MIKGNQNNNWQYKRWKYVFCSMRTIKDLMLKKQVFEILRRKCVYKW